MERQVAIVGVAESDLGNVAPQTLLQMQARAAREALADAGLNFKDVDALFTAGTGWANLPVLALADYLGLQNARVLDGTNLGGSSFEIHVGHAAAMISLGLCEVALITYANTPRSAPVPRPGGPKARFLDQFERPYGPTHPITSYALAAMRHMHLYGTTSEQLAEVAVATRKWAMLNPKAYKREPLTVSDVLASPYIVEPLRLLDCCLVVDGGGALVVTSAAVARQCRTAPVWVLGWAETTTHMLISSMSDLTLTGAHLTGPRAMHMAGVTHRDIDVVEVYDSFTITVLLTLEALGFCGPGESGSFVAGQRTAPGGDFPMNTNGGGLSYCHPGMYGLLLLIEATRQLRGECGERQVRDAKLSLVHGTGGVLSSHGTCILGRD